MKFFSVWNRKSSCNRSQRLAVISLSFCRSPNKETRPALIKTPKFPQRETRQQFCKWRPQAVYWFDSQKPEPVFRVERSSSGVKVGQAAQLQDGRHKVQHTLDNKTMVLLSGERPGSDYDALRTQSGRTVVVRIPVWFVFRLRTLYFVSPNAVVLVVGGVVVVVFWHPLQGCAKTFCTDTHKCHSSFLMRQLQRSVPCWILVIFCAVISFSKGNEKTQSPRWIIRFCLFLHFMKLCFSFSGWNNTVLLGYAAWDILSSVIGSQPAWVQRPISRSRWPWKPSRNSGEQQRHGQCKTYTGRATSLVSNFQRYMQQQPWRRRQN